MLIGIVKNGVEILGDCEIRDVINSSNRVRTVVCNGIIANATDRVIYLCEKCSSKTLEMKRHFASSKGFQQICRRCKLEETSLQRYGTKSPNHVPSIKQKQQGTDKIYKVGNDYQPTKTSSPEELSKLRSEITSSKWQNGDYANSTEAFRQAGIKKWENPEFVEKVLSSLRSPENRLANSIRTKRRWTEGDSEAISRMLRRGLKPRISKLHQKIRQRLDLESKGFVSERIVGRYIVDELNEHTKTVIEVNGDYVHANPAIYKSTDIIRLAKTRYTAAEKWEYDQQRKSKIEALGYRVIILWESDTHEEMRAKLGSL